MRLIAFFLLVDFRAPMAPKRVSQKSIDISAQNEVCAESGCLQFVVSVHASHWFHDDDDDDVDEKSPCLEAEIQVLQTR